MTSKQQTPIAAMSDREALRFELEELAAAEEEWELFDGNPHRALAAISKARKAGATNVLRYAVQVFNSNDFSTPRTDYTNRAVVIDCPRCGGDRMILHQDYDPLKPYEEIYVRCPECNAK